MSDEILNEGDEGALDPMDFIPEEKRGPGRPRKVVAVENAAHVTEAPAAVPDATTAAMLNTFRETVEKLCDRLDENPRDGNSYELLQKVLAQNADMLKETFRKDNPRHPDVSFYNPAGERDHPRPGLKRPVRFLGIPFNQYELRIDEIEMYNSVDRSMETADHRWRASIIRQANGSEELFISVPFDNGFDSLRGLPGPMAIMAAIKAGVPSHHGDTVNDQVTALRAEMAELRALLAAKNAPEPVAV